VIKLVWTIAIFCGAFAATSLGAQEPSDHVDMGVAAGEAHDPGTALRHFQAALDQDSMNYQANWRGALLLIELGEEIPDSIKSSRRDSLYSLAERYARRAVSADSLGADGHFALAAAAGSDALTMGQKARIRRAGIIRNEALKAIALNPKHDGAYHILGRWNAEIMRLSGFNRFFAKNFLGAGVFKEASWNNAINYMEKAVALDPGRIYHHLELAQIYVDRKRKADAEAQLDAVDSLPLREPMDSVYKQQGAGLRRRLAKR
jgi:regulator of microtubule dynamics protein 3